MLLPTFLQSHLVNFLPSFTLLLSNLTSPPLLGYLHIISGESVYFRYLLIHHRITALPLVLYQLLRAPRGTPGKKKPSGHRIPEKQEELEVL